MKKLFIFMVVALGWLGIEINNADAGNLSKSAMKSARVYMRVKKVGLKMLKDEGKQLAENGLKYSLCASRSFRERVAHTVTDELRSSGWDISFEMTNGIIMAVLECKKLGYEEKQQEAEQKNNSEPTVKPKQESREKRKPSPAPAQQASGIRRPVLCPRTPAYINVGNDWKEIILSPNSVLDNAQSFTQESDHSRWIKGMIGQLEVSVRESDVLGQNCEGAVSVYRAPQQQTDYCPPGRRGITGTCYATMPSPYMKPLFPPICIGLACR